MIVQLLVGIACVVLLGLAYVVEAVARYALLIPKRKPEVLLDVKLISIGLALLGYALMVILIWAGLSIMVQVGGLAYMIVGFGVVSGVARIYAQAKNPSIEQKSIPEILFRRR